MSAPGVDARTVETSRHASCSFWLETAGEDLAPRPALDGSIDCDVAILGAGFTGLWTAYYLLKRRPALRVAILEREIAGFGASGRNGGWCSSKLNISLDAIAERHGAEAAKAVQRAMFEAVDEIGRVAAAEGIDCDYTRGGALFAARGPHQIGEMRAYAASYERFGFGDRVALLDAAETSRRVRVRGALGSFHSPGYASVHPGRLVRGLARTVERLGGRIHEGTEVTSFVAAGRRPAVPSRRALLRTPRGDVRAGVVVLAGEAYLTRLPRLRRQLLPIYSLIVLTEPLSGSQWEEIGWRNRECLASFRLSVDYLARTGDGRILFGGRGAPYHYGSAIADAYDRDAPTHEMLRALARDWFPCLEKTRFTHAWGGPLGMPRDWMPAIVHDPARGVASARGYTGHGVSASNLGGRTLADLILGERTERTLLPLVGHRSPDWEPEPLRFLAVRYIQRAFARLDERAARTGRPPTGRSLAERLARH
jgi:glycine/D-amino acid oxidase-like deaminating enzyme